MTLDVSNRQYSKGKLADIIQKTLEDSGRHFIEQGRLSVTRVDREEFIHIRCFDVQRTKPLHFLVEPDHIRGDDPKDYKGDTMYDALIQNVDEALSAEGFRYVVGIGYIHIPGSESSPEIP